MAKEEVADRERLVSSARSLRAELIPHITGPIEFRQSIRTAEEDTDGWCTTIADLDDALSKDKYKLELWYDTFSRGDGRRYWCGFAAPGKKAINVLVRKCPKHLKPEILLNDAKLDQTAPFSMLQEPLSKVPKRSLEKYNSGGYSYFGLYTDFGDLNLPEAVKFLQGVISCLPEFALDQLADNYSGIENRRYVATHLRRERDAKLAKLCKERDEYKCRICGLLFEEEYGPLGKGFAEAHHIVPLNKLERAVQNSKNDLITVCSNCHRMLHRLPGEVGDIETLKKVVAQLALRRSGAGADRTAPSTTSSVAFAE